jgi:hypothetical protein
MSRLLAENRTFYTGRIRATDQPSRNQITPLTKLTRLPNVTVEVSTSKISNKVASTFKDKKHCFISKKDIVNWKVINLS